MKNAMQLKAIMKKLAKENQISAQLVLQNYMLERFLERVSLSPYRDNYIIKGGFLISSMVGLNSRATMDMDATIKGYPVTQDAVQKMIEQILTVPVDDDITFTFKSIGEIREGDEYTGYRVALPCAVGLPLPMAHCAGRCRGTLIYPAISGKWTLSAMPGIAARIFPRRREHLSSLPTAARC